MNKKKSHTLEVKPENPPVLFGIISTENDYSLSFQLNRALNIELTRQDDFVLERKGKPSLFFPSFSYISSDDTVGYQLLKNKTQGQVLVAEHKTTDYFLLIFGDNNDNIIHSLHEKIRQIPGVNVVMPLNFTEIRPFNKLFL
ncbi:MAG: IPExxxVDY family protein [Bacteroidota bacterium]